MATNATNATNAGYASLSPREKGLFILSQVTCVADEANVINPENVRHGFVITGFAPPVNTRPATFNNDIALPALGLLRAHITKYSSDELQHCVISGCPVQDAQSWVNAGVNVREGVSPYRSSIDDPSQFICFCASIITSTRRAIPNVVISGTDEKAIMRTVFRLGYYGLLTQDSWAFLYPGIPADFEQCWLDLST